jgi:hypothetical protein
MFDGAKIGTFIFTTKSIANFFFHRLDSVTLRHCHSERFLLMS